MVDGRLAELKLVGKLGHVTIALGQKTQDPQPALVAQGPVEADGGGRRRESVGAAEGVVGNRIADQLRLADLRQRVVGTTEVGGGEHDSANARVRHKPDAAGSLLHESEWVHDRVLASSGGYVPFEHSPDTVLDGLVAGQPGMNDLARSRSQFLGSGCQDRHSLQVLQLSLQGGEGLRVAVECEPRRGGQLLVFEKLSQEALHERLVREFVHCGYYLTGRLDLGPTDHHAGDLGDETRARAGPGASTQRPGEVCPRLLQPGAVLGEQVFELAAVVAGAREEVVSLSL